MKIKNMLRRNFLQLFLFAVNISILPVTFPIQAEAQTNSLVKEKAVCKMKVNNMDCQLNSNINGHFFNVADVKPFAVIPMEITYPQGIPGEKIVLAAEDGGTFDNKQAVMVTSLDNGKRCSFNFQITDQKGIFEVTLRKGKDRKVIQLWIGDEVSISGK